MTTFRSGAATHTGRIRRSNQDQFLDQAPLFAVADGMGGHNGGEVASEIAVTALGAADALGSVTDLVHLVERVNAAIVERARDEPSLRGMGTTVTVLSGLRGAGPARLAVANVGDSRLYRVTDDGLHQHTEDHSLVESLVRDGRLTRAEAAVHPQRNIVTRALGIDDRVLVDAWELSPVVGDRYLLCSDGLFNELSGSEIHTVLTEIDDPETAADELVGRAVAAGGRDNVSVVVVDIVEADSVDDVPDDRITESRPALPDRTPAQEPEGATVFDELEDEDMPPDPDPDEVRLADPTAPLTWRVWAFVAAVLVVVGTLLVSLVVYARSGYFVDEADDGTVAVYQGRPGGLLWFDPTVEIDSDLVVTDLTELDRVVVEEQTTFSSLGDAERFLAQARSESAVADS